MNRSNKEPYDRAVTLLQKRAIRAGTQFEPPSSRRSRITDELVILRDNRGEELGRWHIIEKANGDFSLTSIL